jgi:nucleotide-binding universal stress UspA family protein
MVQAMRDMLPQIERRLQARVKETPTKVPVHTAVVEAVTPAGALLDYVKKFSIDLIIMGTHGRGAIAHALLGSVAERLARTAPVPVMTVRPKGR